MRIAIAFDADGAAFADDFANEVARVLAQATSIIASFSAESPCVHSGACGLRDSNGNTIGSVVCSRTECPNCGHYLGNMSPGQACPNCGQD